uniref:Uncharacterized protein n=1 Tax=Rhizophora mucronata TaxID=61149 RepID=A0A2P2KS03_RHIMU
MSLFKPENVEAWGVVQESLRCQLLGCIQQNVQNFHKLTESLDSPNEEIERLGRLLFAYFLHKHTSIQKSTL